MYFSKIIFVYWIIGRIFRNRENIKRLKGAFRNIEIVGLKPMLCPNSSKHMIPKPSSGPTNSHPVYKPLSPTSTLIHEPIFKIRTWGGKTKNSQRLI